jgi:hypothetical protein
MSKLERPMSNKALACVAAVLGAFILGLLLAAADTPVWAFIVIVFAVVLSFYLAWEESQ